MNWVSASLTLSAPSKTRNRLLLFLSLAWPGLAKICVKMYTLFCLQNSAFLFGVTEPCGLQPVCLIDSVIFRF